MDDNPGYSKWRKPTAEPKPEDIARKEQQKVKYEQNEERRRLMMLENQRRRKQKESRLRQEEERKRRAQQQLLNQRRKDKEQAYIKYLRNNAAPLPQSQPTTVVKRNLYDKYEAKKREEQQQVEEIKPASKWNKSGKKEEDNLMGLDLEVQNMKDLSRIKQFYEEGKQQLKVFRAFEEQWEDSHQLIQSSLLDSLDLDGQAVAKSKIMAKKEPAIFEKDYADMKKSIALAVEQHIERPAEEKDIKDLIGYESGSNFWELDTKKKPVAQSKPQQVPVVKEQQQPSNAFRKKKDGKEPARPTQHPKEDGEAITRQLLKKKPNLMEWAVDTAEQTDQLFSNCSSNISKGSFPRSHLLKQLNERKKLPEIKQQETEQSHDKRSSAHLPTKQRPADNRSNRSSSRQKGFKAVIRKTPEKINSKSREKDPKPGQKDSLTSLQQPLRSSKEKYAEEKPFPLKPNPNKSSTSLKKEETVAPPPPKPPVKKESKTVEKFRSRLSQQPSKPTTTVCTQDDMLHIDEFIKDELRDLNARQLQLQQQIKKMHLQSKERVKDVEQRYEVNTKLQSTREVTQQPAPPPKKNMSESQLLEESLYRIEEMLIRKEQNIKQLQQQILQQQQQAPYESSPPDIEVSDVATPEFNQRQEKMPPNCIDPMASSNDLLEQVTKLTAKINQRSGTDKAIAEASAVSTKPASTGSEQQSKAGSYAELRKLQKEQEQQPRISKWKKATSQEKDQLVSQKPSEQSAKPPNQQPSIPQPLQQPRPMPPQEQRISVNDRLRNLLLE